MEVFNVLWWAFAQPQSLLNYRERVGAERLATIGAWYTTILIWVPLLIPTVGYFVGHIPLSDTVSTIFMVSMPLSFWFIFKRKDLVGAALGSLFYFIHLIDKSAADGNYRIALLTNVAIVTTYLAAMVLTIASTGSSFPISGYALLGGGVGTWVALHVGGKGLIEGFVAGVAVTVAMAPVVLMTRYRLKQRIPRGQPSYVAWIILPLTCCSLALLIWIYWLNGWQVLNS